MWHLYSGTSILFNLWQLNFHLLLSSTFSPWELSNEWGTSQNENLIIWNLKITSPINLLDRLFLKQFKTFNVRILSDLNILGFALYLYIWKNTALHVLKSTSQTSNPHPLISTIYKMKMLWNVNVWCCIHYMPRDRFSFNCEDWVVFYRWIKTDTHDF